MLAELRIVANIDLLGAANDLVLPAVASSMVRFMNCESMGSDPNFP
jgi:hypothetical protein